MIRDLHRFQECPGCASHIRECDVLFSVEMFGSPCDVLKCRPCGLVFKEHYPGDLHNLYTTDYVHFCQAQAPGAAELISARQKLRRCQRFLGRRKEAVDIRLLDVGCGGGQFVRMARSLGYCAEGIDPFLPEHLTEAGVSRSKPEDLPAASYDIVTLLNVAEHATDPGALFAAVGRLIRPCGVLLVTCPYGDSWARRLYKARWAHLALDEHILFWTPSSLNRALTRSGFIEKSNVRIAGSPFPYGLIRNVHECSKSMPIPKVTHQTLQHQALQQRAWQLARWIQAREGLGNVVRRLVHMTQFGDYLEYVVRKSN